MFASSPVWFFITASEWRAVEPDGQPASVRMWFSNCYQPQPSNFQWLELWIKHLSSAVSRKADMLSLFQDDSTRGRTIRTGKPAAGLQNLVGAVISQDRRLVAVRCTNPDAVQQVLAATLPAGALKNHTPSDHPCLGSSGDGPEDSTP